MNDFAEDEYQPEPGGYGGDRYGEDYGGHPAIATAICAFLLVASCAGARERAVSVTSEHDVAYLAGMVFGGAIFGAVLWGISYAITIKRASPGWKAGSLIVLALLGLLTSLARVGLPRSAMREDAAATLNQMQALLASGGEDGPMKVDPKAGPMAKMMATFVNGILEDSKAFNTEAEAAGLETVVSFNGLTKTTPALDHCDRIDALAKRAEGAKTGLAGRIDAVRKQGEGFVAAGEMDQGDLDAFLRGMNGNHATYERQWALTGQLTTDAASLCRILARRRWQLGADGKVAFTSPSDLAEAQPIVARINATGVEMRSNQDAARGDAKTSMQKMREL